MSAVGRIRQGGETCATHGENVVYLKMQKLHPNKMFLHESAFVAPKATLVGHITLGENASVWYGAVLRGDIEPITVGKDTNIQDNCVVHNDEGFPVVIGDRVTIGHGAVLHGCTIEDEVLVAMNAVILTGVKIGTGSYIAAGAVVKENTIIPPRSFVVGVPAVIKGPANEQHHERILQGARAYVAYSRAYLNGEAGG